MLKIKVYLNQFKFISVEKVTLTKSRLNKLILQSKMSYNALNLAKLKGVSYSSFTLGIFCLVTSAYWFLKMNRVVGWCKGAW